MYSIHMDVISHALDRWKQMWGIEVYLICFVGVRLAEAQEAT